VPGLVLIEQRLGIIEDALPILRVPNVEIGDREPDDLLERDSSTGKVHLREPWHVGVLRKDVDVTFRPNVGVPVPRHECIVELRPDANAVDVLEVVDPPFARESPTPLEFEAMRGGKVDGVATVAREANGILAEAKRVRTKAASRDISGPDCLGYDLQRSLEDLDVPG